MPTSKLLMTPALAAAVVERLADRGLTYKDVKEAGGPAAASMTYIVKGDCRPISELVCRKLDTALAWDKGTARRLAAGGRADAPAPVITRVVDGEVVEITDEPELLDLFAQLRDWLALGREILDEMDRQAARPDVGPRT